MKYGHIFETVDEQNAYIFSKDYIEPFVGVVRQDGENSIASYNRFYDTDITDDLYDIPLTAGIIVGGNFTIRSSHSALTKTIEYKKNDGSWTSINITTATTTISVVAGDKLSFRGNNGTYSAGNLDGENTHCAFGRYDSGTTCHFILYGNIMSLIDKTNFANLTQFTETYTFQSLFWADYGLKDASGLVLPATVLTLNCYTGMFSGVQFKYPPKVLPATIVAPAAYNSMFAWNWNLIEPPKIEARIVQQWACSGMFNGCTAMRKAPELLISVAGEHGCQSMFQNTPIERFPNFGIMSFNGAEVCNSMFKGCSAMTSFPSELPATELTSYCYSGMFIGCSGLEKAPALIAIDPVDHAYNNMFSGCTKLNHVTSYLSGTGNSVTNGWLSGVASYGSLYKKSGTTYTSGVSGLPSGWDARDIFIV